MKQNLIIPAVLTLFFAGTAQAQHFETQQLYQRMGKLENDFNLLQRQVARGEAVPNGGVSENVGQIGAEIARIDEEIRNLRGQIEQLSFETEQTQKQITKMQEDNDYRFRALEDKAAGVAAMTPNPAMSSTETQEADAVAEESGQLQDELENVARSQPEGKLGLPSKDTPMSARDLYNHAFKLLNQTDYAGAEKAFLQFTNNFADDPLIGNAWYWLGEAYYVQRDYAKAADSFRQGFQKLPDGPKAGDNLLKLAMTLAAMERGQEACVVLNQVRQKFASNSEVLRNKTQLESNKLGCK